MKNIWLTILALAFIAASVPAAIAHPMHGMPRDPISMAGWCAKNSGGFHVPYRGWRTRNLLAYRTCMWPFW
ncbi:MAG: hypothetical protein J0I29_04760, partial [Rhizobiales bacterium]|nr:hypothetical protein [Hyphomicrobiales bacterium]